jgi:hypothetical protein
LPTALVAALTLSACTDAAEPRTESDLSESFRMGRVHVVLEPEAESETGDELQVTARFAFVRGLEEDFVRARLDMGLMPDEILKPSQCSADLYTGDPDEPSEDPRELVLVDIGDLSVLLGDAQVHVPLSLVPDLLPYMSGVEYIYYGDGLPQAMDATLAVEAEGSSTEELPPFAVEGAVPRGLGLTFTDEDAAEIRKGALVLRWDPQGDGPITLTLTPLIDQEIAGEEITCVFDDVGQARLDLQELQTYGLPLAADSLRVVASRTSTTTFDAGEFQGSELVIERRASVRYPLR